MAEFDRPSKPLRTIAYIDGYNLYYSALTGGPFKWLDVRRLVERVIQDSAPKPLFKLLAVKFFTAPILGRYASDQTSPDRQRRYHNALKFAPSGPTEIITGYHATTTKKARILETEELVRVSVLEEKQTDVNIGLHIYRDACRQLVDQVVLASNDSDLAPVLEMIADDFPAIARGVVLPTLDRSNRRSGQLDALSNWTRRQLRISELEACQLPRAILNRKGKPILKPEQW